MKSIAILVLVASAVLAVDAAHERFKIENLPGAGPIGFNQYSGYITFNQTHGRNMFFWFVESQSATPTDDPLVLWLNGGPGCSSLGGLLSENGPFYPDGTENLVNNEWSWNKVANVLYLESPSGVGFSYSETPSDYTTGDAQTATDSLEFLLIWFKEFSEYKANPFWITGESYAGHYIPNLAKTIVNYNTQQGDKVINLHGIMAGNAWTDPPLDNEGAAFMWYTHALNSVATYQGLLDFCDFNTVGPLKNTPDPIRCDKFQSLATVEMGNINIYDIYADVCLSRGSNGARLMQLLSETKAPLAKINKHLANVQFPPYEPCIDDFLATYLNRKDVQAAIHANISYPWVDCSNLVSYSRADLLTSVIPVYQFLFTTGIRILVYSGDVDGIVPVTGTRAWINSMNMTITEPWRPWTGSDGQVAGYQVQYQNMMLATVREAGHMVPWTQPQRAFDMFSRFLKS